MYGDVFFNLFQGVVADICVESNTQSVIGVQTVCLQFLVCLDMYLAHAVHIVVGSSQICLFNLSNG